MKIIKSILFLLFVVSVTFIIINTVKTDLKNVTIIDFNKSYKIYTDKTKVSDIIKAAGLKINKYDLVYPELNSFITEDTITICRVNEIYKTKIVPVNQKTINVKSMALPKGKILVTTPGSKGYRQETYKILFMNGRKADEKRVDIKLISKPRSKIVLTGISEKLSILEEELETELDLHSTAYSPAAASCAPFDDGFSAIGLKADYGIVAVDPKVIPLGSLMYIEGYGYAIAADVGSAIKDNDIDLCFYNENIAKEYGVKEIKGYILK